MKMHVQLIAALATLISASLGSFAANQKAEVKVGAGNQALEIQADSIVCSAEAKGKALKVISQLLRYLPVGFHYRIIFMDRKLEEVVRSQQKMLEHQGKKGANLPEGRLIRAFARQLDEVKRLLASCKIPTLYLDHRECIQHPEFAAQQVNAFLGGGLDESAMAGAVNPGLYRQRSG